MHPTSDKGTGPGGPLRSDDADGAASVPHDTLAGQVGPVQPINDDWRARWTTEHEEALSEATDTLATAQLVMERHGIDPTEARLLLTGCMEAGTRVACCEADLTVETIAVHFPGIAQAIRAVYEHTQAGSSLDGLTCCDDGATL